MRVLICGGTGFLGRHIVNALVQQGHDPVVRSRHSDPALDFADLTQADDWLAHLQSVEAVVNAVGALRDTPRQSLQTLHTDAPIALFDACAQAGVQRVVQVSALGVADSATRYASTKRAADEHLLALNQAGRLNGVVVRPSIIFGAGGASTELFMSLAKLPALLLPQAMQSSHVQPVAVRDLAQVLAQLATSEAPSGVINIGGPEALTLGSLIASLRGQMGRSSALALTMPRWAAELSARVGDRISALPWCTETLTLLQSHNVTDPQTLAKLLGREGVPPGRLYATLPESQSRTRKS
ncbi:NAD-dependent epimerase/dehydratase family protein [Comamonas guangdongensis]|uniref:NAD-dependent epimerase/dehydratase family protein n=1 Tax=Comamonas guangdongensis TaxID=510515 RepID=A0ABV4A0R8_9BURK